MGRQLIGQVLYRMGKLSPMDIDEILEEQALAGRRFGDIAISWGLCDPEHIGEAWCRQLADEGANLDLGSLGIDPHATACLSPADARRLGILPIRIAGEIMILAASHPLDSVAVAELSRMLARDLRFVVVSPAQFECAMDICYRNRAAA
jgi:hypothetical protein